MKDSMDIPKEIMQGKGWEKVPSSGNGHMMLYSDFKCKMVINLRNCKQLGRVSDLEFDERTGCIHKIFVPKGNKWEGFFKCQEDYCIPYRDIKQIGPDIILVDI